jgi:hypothetical protein
MKLYIDYEECRTGGEALEEGPYASRADTIIELTVNSVAFGRNPGFFPHDSIEVDEARAKSEKLYLTVLRYGDGDSFGHSDGNVAFLDAHKSLEKALLYDPIRDNRTYYDIHGYFNSFGCLEIYECDMRCGGRASLVETVYKDYAAVAAAEKESKHCKWP